MEFAKRACATSTPEILHLIKIEVKLIYCKNQIAVLLEHYSILPCLTMYFDQTPLKSCTGGKANTVRKGIKKYRYKMSIAATFGINFANNFLPMQLIYGGKTGKSFYPA